MTNSLPPDLTAFVQGAVTTGKHPSEAALVTAAVRLLKEQDEHEEWLRKEIQIGIDELDRGESTRYDETTSDELLEKIKMEGRRLLAAQQGASGRQVGY